MQKLKRSINLGFRVSVEEQAQIMKRMNEIGFPSLRAYLLKMALDGMVVNVDLTQVQECSRLLRIVSNNVNQLAKHANRGSRVYANDIANITKQLEDVWTQQEKIIKILTKILEVV